MIEIKLYTKKAKLQRVLWDLLQTGRELTYYFGGVSGLVNEEHNSLFLNEIDSLAKHNYIKDISDHEYMRLNKYLDKMTIQQLNERIAHFKKIVDIYKQMPDSTRKALAIAWKVNHLNKCIVTWDSKAAVTKDLTFRYELHKMIQQAKQDIDRLYKQLVA